MPAGVVIGGVISRLGAAASAVTSLGRGVLVGTVPGHVSGASLTGSPVERRTPARVERVVERRAG